MKDRKSKRISKVVNISEDGEITVLNELFYCTDGFCGATGSKFYPVSEDRYNECTEREYVIEYLIDSGIELPDEFKRGGFNELYEAMEANGEIEGFMFDTSYSNLWDYLREECNLSEDEAFIFECTGGGRCFDDNYQGNVNEWLSQYIRDFENPDKAIKNLPIIE